MAKQTFGLLCFTALILLSVIPDGFLASALPIEKVGIHKRSSGCPTDIWSNWTNRDTPTTTWTDREHGEGDNEYFNETEIRAFCPNGNITQVECVPANSSANASQYIYTCDVQNGLLCDNGLNSANGCVDFKIRYKCTVLCPTQHTDSSTTGSTSMISQNQAQHTGNTGSITTGNTSMKLSQNPVQENTQGETTSPTVWKVHAGMCGALFLAVLLLIGKVFFMVKK